jgi:two-component system cell cycle sensor histidine kinase/response regulator CckA
MIAPEDPSLASFAHDFNNLLSVITGYSELMLRRLRPNDPLRTSAESIKKATEWGMALAQQILATSREQGPSSADVNQVAANVAKVLQPAIGERVELVTRFDPDAGRVAMTQIQLGQVIMNLVVNARDAMPDGGRLTIETLCAGSEVVLAVTDTGIGMDTATRERLFEPYFTTKASGKRVEVSSEVGRGSTFTIHLPRVDDETASTEHPAAPPARGARTVLVVDDETDVRDLMREILQFERYEVLEASDQEGALTVVEGHAGPIDLLITDIFLPGSGGDDLAQRVVAARPGIKVIYVSGYLEADDPASARRLGPLLSKPFSVATLTRTVHGALNGTE